MTPSVFKIDYGLTPENSRELLRSTQATFIIRLKYALLSPEAISDNEPTLLYDVHEFVREELVNVES